MPNYIDITGHKYGRLTAMARVDGKVWLCRCECGVEKEINKESLRTGKTVSCGCYMREVASERNKTHGLSKHRQFRRWRGMIDRCTYPKNPKYEIYGGRGIRVCDRWLDFSLFIEDMDASFPGDGWTIERIDTDGDYCPENCKWATYSEQSRNKRTTVFIERNGEKLIGTDWAIRLGVPSKQFLYHALTHGPDAAFEWAERQKEKVQ